MLTYAAMLLAGTMVVGQAEKEKADQPEYNPHLEPLAWMVGDWEMKETSPIGEIKKIRHDTCRWSVDKSVLVSEFTQTKADGSPDMTGLLVYYWDPAEAKIKLLGHIRGSFGNIIEEHSLISIDGGEQLWKSKVILPKGNQGHFHFKLTHSDDTFTIGWSKISGGGPQELGPLVFKRK